MISPQARSAVKSRSGGSCEAMVQIRSGMWTRCWVKPIEIHHLLTRARGGNVLDARKETYHLIGLCRKHHEMSDGGDAYMSGLLIDGYVVTEKGRPVYYGTDPVLNERYGK